MDKIYPFSNMLHSIRDKEKTTLTIKLLIIIPYINKFNPLTYQVVRSYNYLYIILVLSIHKCTINAIMFRINSSINFM